MRRLFALAALVSACSSPSSAPEAPPPAAEQPVAAAPVEVKPAEPAMPAVMTPPGKDASAPKVATSDAMPGVTPPPAPAVPLTPENTKVFFQAAKVTRSHDGDFGMVRGGLTLNPEGTAVTAVTVDVDIASIRTDTPKLTEHLKSEDFFDVAKFPVARFTSAKIEAGEGGKATVSGNLELHGMTRAITFPATIGVEKDAVTVGAEFMFNRKEFGLVYPGLPDDLIRDDVYVKLGVRAQRPSAPPVAAE